MIINKTLIVHPVARWNKSVAQCLAEEEAVVKNYMGLGSSSVQYELVDILLQRQFGMEPNTEVTCHVSGLKDVGTDCQSEVLAGNFPQVGARAEPGNFVLDAIQGKTPCDVM